MGLNECLDDRTVKNTDLYRIGRRDSSLNEEYLKNQPRETKLKRYHVMEGKGMVFS